MSSETVEWVKLGFSVFTFLVSLAFMAFWFKAVGRMMNHTMGALNPTLARDRPEGKYAIRRMFCNHRHVSRVKNSWGLSYTACTKCGKNVNEGKRKEEWR